MAVCVQKWLKIGVSGDLSRWKNSQIICDKNTAPGLYAVSAIYRDLKNGLIDTDESGGHIEIIDEFGIMPESIEKLLKIWA